MSYLRDDELKDFLSQFEDISVEEFHKLEKLRGCPIELRTEDLKDIPCQEISAPEVRAIQPLVSVHMITYNHEKFIADAIEGVVNQKCDFPFELIIGEDCSTDRTREICLEYQKKYPHIIRLLISEKNVGGHYNTMRCTSRIRGKYLAFCEGDDYWTDMSKLQKQVDILAKNTDIGLVSTNYCTLILPEGRYVHNRVQLIEGIHNYYTELDCFPWLPCQTAGYMIRINNSIHSWQNLFFNRLLLTCGDCIVFFNSIAENGNFYIIHDEMYVKRNQPTGASYGDDKFTVCIDAYLVAYYYHTRFDKKFVHDDFFYSVFIYTFRYHLLDIYKRTRNPLQNNDFLEIIAVIDFCLYQTDCKTLRHLRHGLKELWQYQPLKSYVLFICDEMDKRGLSIYDKSNSIFLRMMKCFLSNRYVFGVENFLRKYMYRYF